MQESAAGKLVGQSLGDYLLRGVLGVGGMAEVYRGMDLVLEREVAVKVLPPALAVDEGYVRRFRQEAQQVAALNHPHIVPIYAFGEERGYFYHVMPMLHTSLRDRLHADGRFAPEEAVRLVRQVAAALGAAHTLGLVHRDVKPENILLDAEANALLTDFGIARQLAPLSQIGVARTLANTGMLLGTPEYMAPEQLRAEPCDQRADVYGLGVVLYELLTGVPPFQAASPFEIAALALYSPILPPSRRNPQVWPALEQTVLKALSRDPADRYPDMQSFSAALDLALHRTDALWSSPTLPPSRLRTRRLASPWWKRAQRPFAVALAAALLLLAGAGGSALLFMGRNTTNARGTGDVSLASGTPTATAIATASSLPTTTPSSASTAPPGRNPTPVPTATPQLTPTIVVSSNPLNFQPYPSAAPKNCVAEQTLTNTSVVDAQWSWHNSAGGWQYNTAGFNSTSWPGFPSVLTMTTPAHSSVYIYIRTGLDTACKSHSTVATITVTGGNGTSFNASY